MNENKKKTEGFTLIEVMIASAILLIALESLFSVFWSTQLLVDRGTASNDMQAVGRIGMEKLERNLRMGITPTILAGGDQINFTFDTSANPDSPTLVTRSIYFSSTDGIESTADDNYLVYDPNTSYSGDEETIMNNVRRPSGGVIFSVSGKVVTVKVRLEKSLAFYGSSETIDVDSTVRMRN